MPHQLLQRLPERPDSDPDDASVAPPPSPSGSTPGTLIVGSHPIGITPRPPSLHRFPAARGSTPAPREDDAARCRVRQCRDRRRRSRPDVPAALGITSRACNADPRRRSRNDSPGATQVRPSGPDARLFDATPIRNELHAVLRPQPQMQAAGERPVRQSPPAVARSLSSSFLATSATQRPPGSDSSTSPTAEIDALDRPMIAIDAGRSADARSFVAICHRRRHRQPLGASEQTLGALLDRPTHLPAG